jgi:hypothetical protein
MFGRNKTPELSSKKVSNKLNIMKLIDRTRLRIAISRKEW